LDFALLSRAVFRRPQPWGEVKVTAANLTETIEAARVYLKRGWPPIPLHGKKPFSEDWTNLRLSEEDLDKVFSNGCNVGVLVGEPAHGLADIDLDSPEALALARFFLPKTGAIFGRPQKRASHWLYMATPAGFTRTSFADPTAKKEAPDKGMLVELRGTGGQTMFPPSRHPDGEDVTWDAQGQPAASDYEGLHRKVAVLAGAALLARHWPVRGSRHDAALALAGALIRSGWTEQEVDKIVYLVAWAGHDDEAKARRADVKTTSRKVANGEQTTGQPTCAKIFGERVWTKAAEWLDLKRVAGSETGAEPPRPLRRALPAAEAFPVAELGPVLAGAAKAVQRRIKSPMAICANSVLAAATLAVQGHINVELPYGGVRPVSEYFITVADTGERKTSTDDEVLIPVREYELELSRDYAVLRDEYRIERAAWEKQRDQILGDRKNNPTAGTKRAGLKELGPEPLPPLPPMLLCSEPTYEGLVRRLREGRASAGLFSGEGGRFVGGHAMSEDNRLKTAGGFSDLWDGKAIDRVRQGDGVYTLPGRRLTIHLLVQPMVAARFFSDRTLQDQGLLSRVLAVQPESAAGSRFWEEGQDFSDFSHFSRRLTTTLQLPLPTVDGRGELIPATFRLEPDAKRLWTEYHDEIERQIGQGGPREAIKGFCNKLPEHAARLGAVICKFTDFNAVNLSAEWMARGISLAESYASEQLRVYEACEDSLDLTLAQRLLDWLRITWREPSSYVSLPDIYQYGPRPIHDQATATRIVSILVEHGWLEPLSAPAQVNGTTRRKAWRIRSEG
jgi:hypothetical protein